MRKSILKSKGMTDFDTRLQAIFDRAEEALDELEAARRFLGAIGLVAAVYPGDRSLALEALRSGLVASIDRAAASVTALQRQTFG